MNPREKEEKTVKKWIRRLLVIGIVFALVAGCSGKDQTTDTEETSNEVSEDKGQVENEDKTESKARVIDKSDDSVQSSLEELTESYEEGEVTELEYSMNLVSLAFSESQEVIVREGEQYDLSDNAQMLVDNYTSLDAEGQKLVDHMMGDYTTSDDSARLMDYFMPRVHAEDTLYPKKIMEGAYLTHPLVDVALNTELESMIIDNYLAVESMVGGPLGMVKSKYRILITTYPMIDAFSSYSVLDIRPLGLDSDFEYGQTFVIHLNSEADEDTLKGSLIHELFHAYQYEMGYSRKNNMEKFLMESTAIWAVTHVDKELFYPYMYEDELYVNQVNFDVAFMDDALRKSWFQFHWFITEEMLVPNYIKELLENGLISDQFMSTLNLTLPEEQMHTVMADFGQRLVCNISDSSVGMPEEAPYADDAMGPTEFDVVTIEELMIKTTESSMSEIPFISPGFIFYKTDLGERGEVIVDVMNNVEGMAGYDLTGLTALYQEGGQWKVLLNGGRDEFTGKLDTKDKEIGELVFIFFSFNDMENPNHQYSLTLQERIKGEGSITIHIKQTNLADSDSKIVHDVAEYDMDITEDVELFKVEGGSYDDMMVDLLMGDSYFVKKFQALHTGERIIRYEDGTRDTYDYNGEFIFNSDQAGDNDYPNNMISNSFTGMLDQAKEMLDQMPGLPDMSDLPGGDSAGGIELPDLGGLQDQMNDAINSAMDEIGGAGLDMDLLFPNPNKLMRLKEIPQNETFHIYPTMPVGLLDTDWIEVNTTKTFFDDEGNLQTTTDYGHTQIVFDPYPLWFRNVNYDPQAVEDMADTIPQDPAEWAANFDEMSDVTDQLLFINGNLDATNLYHSFDSGEESFIIESFDSAKQGDMYQELIFTESGFEAMIRSTYTEYGSEYEVNLHMKYDFR